MIKLKRIKVQSVYLNKYYRCSEVASHVIARAFSTKTVAVEMSQSKFSRLFLREKKRTWWSNLLSPQSKAIGLDCRSRRSVRSRYKMIRLANVQTLENRFNVHQPMPNRITPTIECRVLVRSAWTPSWPPLCVRRCSLSPPILSLLSPEWQIVDWVWRFFSKW